MRAVHAQIAWARHDNPILRRHPVACGIMGSDESMHLIEASRALPDQMRLWADSLGKQGVVRPDSLSLTHVHIGHVDGIGQFGKEVMGLINKIKATYGNDVPPPIQKLESDAMKAANKEGFASSPVKTNIADYWNDTLRYHQKTGTKPDRAVVTTFNPINTLLRKV